MTIIRPTKFRGLLRRMPLLAAAVSAAALLIPDTGAAQAPRPSVDVPYPGSQGGYQGQPTRQQLRCIQLEQELANDWTAGQRGNNELPKIREQIRKYDRIYQQTRNKAERANCYQSLFIFGRSLNRTPRCIRLHNQIEDARQRLASLQQRQERLSSRRGD